MFICLSHIGLNARIRPEASLTFFTTTKKVHNAAKEVFTSKQCRGELKFFQRQVTNIPSIYA